MWLLNRCEVKSTPADVFPQILACTNNRQERAHLIAVYLSVSDIFNTPPLLYLLLCLITAVSLPSSAVLYHINARFKCDEMLILVMEGRLRTLLFKLANGWSVDQRLRWSWPLKQGCDCRLASHVTHDAFGCALKGCI